MAQIKDIQNHQASQLAASSWLSYNGLLLTDVLTEEFSFEEVRTPDGAQALYEHVTIKVSALIEPSLNNFSTSPGAPGTVFRGVPTAMSTENIQIFYDQLMKDRGLLKYSMQGKVVIQSPPVDTADGNNFPCDANQGPKPLYCQITQISGTGSFYVRFGIETWLDKCTLGGRAIRAHRFSMAHDVDGDTWLTTRIVTGHVYFRPEWLEKRQQVPDQIDFPSFFHPLDNGFKRQNVKVQALPNGMEVGYSFSDTEQVLPLGTLSPALKLQAEFSTGSFVHEGNPGIFAICHVSAVGPKNEYRYNLLVQAMRVALRKLQKPGLVSVNEMAVNYSLDNMYVDLIVKAKWKPGGVGLEGLLITNTGLTPADDTGDLDAALSVFRVPGEALQGSNPDQAESPKMNLGERKGTWAGMCVGSGIVNGCFVKGKFPQQADFAGGSDFELDDSQPGYTGGGDFETTLTPKTDRGDSAQYTLSIVSSLTIQLLSTGLSSAYAAAIGFYEEWKMNTRYHTVHQRAILPTGSGQSTSPGDYSTYRPPQVGTLGNPYTIKTVDWSIAWVGPSASQIMLPSPDTGDSNDILLEESIQPAAPGFCNSTNKAWRVSGTYKYLSLKMRTSSAAVKSQYSLIDYGSGATAFVDDGFSLGKAITDPSARAENIIGQSRFIAGYSPSFVG